MNYSTNYSMREPVPGEKVKVADINYNTEIIDGVMLDNRQISIDMYDDTSTYNTDDLAGHENSQNRIAVYRCLEDNITGPWDSTKWVQTNLADEITDIRDNAGASDLGDLNDVDLTNPTDGQVLTYDDQNDEWVNSDLPDADVTKEASGNPIEFTDGADAPLVKCVTEITGSQDLHGYDKPWVGGAGKNKCFYSGTNNTVIAYCKSGVTYTFSALFTESTGCILRKNVQAGDAVSSLNGTGTVSTTFTADEDFNLFLNGYSGFASKSTNLQLEQGSVATSYEPYSNICPITAYDEGEIEVRGKNGFDPSLVQNNKSINASGVITDTLGFGAYGPYRVKSGNDVTFGFVSTNDSTTTRIHGYDSFGNWVEQIDSLLTTTEGQKSLTVTIPQNVVFVKVSTRNTFTNMQLESGSTATTYEPYTSTTHTTTYPSAIYRGSEDVVKGEVRSDMPVVDLGDLTWQASGIAQNCFYSYSLTDYKFTSDTNMIASAYSFEGSTEDGVSELANKPDGSFMVYYRAGRNEREIYFKDTRYTSASDFTAAVTGVKLAYELVTPTTSSVTPTNLPIKSLSGYNHIESSTGDMEIEYFPQKEQPLIDLIPEASNMHEYSTEEHAVGTWIDGETIYEKTYTYSGNVAANPFQTTIDMTGKNIIEVIPHYARYTYNSGQSYGECIGSELWNVSSGILDIKYDPEPYTLRVYSFLGNSTESYNIAFTLRYTKTASNNRSLAKSAPTEEVKEEQVEELKEETTEETKEEVKEEPEETKEEPVEEVKEEETKEEGEVNER